MIRASKNVAEKIVKRKGEEAIINQKWVSSILRDLIWLQFQICGMIKKKKSF